MKLMLGIYFRYHKWTWLYENLRSVIEDDTDLPRGGLANRIPPEEFWDPHAGGVYPAG